MSVHTVLVHSYDKEAEYYATKGSYTTLLGHIQENNSIFDLASDISLYPDTLALPDDNRGCLTLLADIADALDIDDLSFARFANSRFCFIYTSDPI